MTTTTTYPVTLFPHAERALALVVDTMRSHPATASLPEVAYWRVSELSVRLGYTPVWDALHDILPAMLSAVGHLTQISTTQVILDRAWGPDGAAIQEWVDLSEDAEHAARGPRWRSRNPANVKKEE